jgi:signal peptidase II
MMHPEQPIEILPGYLRLSYAQNTGVAFGFFSGAGWPWKPYILAALAVAAVVMILIYGARMPSSRVLLHWSLAIILGGILGNLVDRALRGYVIDFIDFHIHEAFYWPTFNIADSAISVGIALLLIDTVRNSADEEAAEVEPS